MKDLDKAIEGMNAQDLAEYEEIIELWVTYGGE
jgi:hypothetical protein